MRPLCVVKVQPCRPRHVAFLLTGIGPSVSPLAQAGLDEPLGFAVSTGSVRPGSQMAQALACTGLPEHVAAIAVAVVGHHPLNRNAVAGKTGERAFQKAGGAFLAFVGQYLAVGKTAGYTYAVE